MRLRRSTKDLIDSVVKSLVRSSVTVEVRSQVDVARRARVSQKTVSRVVNQAPHVRPEVRARVLKAIDDLGYRPNAAARALASQRTRVIGVLVVGLSLFGPSNRVFSLERAARQRGYELALASRQDVSSAGIRD